MESVTTANTPRILIMLTVAAGYIAACFISALLYFLVDELERAIMLGRSFGMPIWDWVVATFLFFLIILTVCLPGFLILRLILRLTRRSDILSFALAGATLPVIVAICIAGFSESSTLAFPVFSKLSFLGALAGAVACLTERWLRNRCQKILTERSQANWLEA